MTNPEPLTPALRTIVLDDLKPVRPLASPWRRTARVAPVAILLAAAIPLALGLRPNFGGSVAYTSVLLLVAGLCSVGVALWDAIPGRNVSARNLWWTAVCAIGIFFGAMLLAAAAGRLPIPSGEELLVFRVCSRMPALLGLPILALVLYLIFRAFPVRPALCGAIAGLGCGLIVESGWRACCPHGDPIHVLTTHGVAVATLSVIGAATGWLWARKRL